MIDVDARRRQGRQRHELAEGVLSLETTLAGVWPGLELPDRGRQADAITLRDLLVHSIPFRVTEITFLEQRTYTR
jgi:hypothetical protein